MEFSYQDKGNYLRGLLILIGKDNTVNDNERTKVIELGRKMGFDPKFCSDAVNDLLENKFIDEKPPKFSSKEITEQFLNDAFHLAIVDNEMQVEELEWLKHVSDENSLEEKWFDKNLQDATSKLKNVKEFTSM